MHSACRSTLTIALLVGAFLPACGSKLTSVEAEAALRAAYFDVDPNLYCTLAGPILFTDEGGAGAAKRFSQLGEDGPSDACLQDLEDVGVVAVNGCAKESASGRCETDTYGFASGVDVSSRPRFACGRKVLQSVDSITTEGQSATAKYSLQLTRDEKLLGRLSHCTIESKGPGTLQETAVLKKDDAGKWSTASKWSPPSATFVPRAGGDPCKRLLACCAVPAPNAGPSQHVICDAGRQGKFNDKECRDSADSIFQFLKIFSMNPNQGPIPPACSAER